MAASNTRFTQSSLVNQKIPLTVITVSTATSHGSRDLFGFLLAVGCKSCVRPVCAVLMTAGPDVIRRSGPYHSLALDSA